MQQQLGQCATAEDFSTILAVGMFASILTTCDAVNGAVSQSCDDSQVQMLTRTCYNADHSPNCAACLPMITQMAPMCPATFLDGEPAQLVAMCGAQAQVTAAEQMANCPDVTTSSVAVTTTCCDEPSEDCSSGVPSSCNAGCAAVFIPFYNDCGGLLGPALDMYAPLLAQCQAACPQCRTTNGAPIAGGGH
jgi:hypothetical protein